MVYLKSSKKRKFSEMNPDAEEYDKKHKKTSLIKPKVVQDGKSRTSGYYGRYGIPSNSGTGKPEKKFFDGRVPLAVMTTATDRGSWAIIPSVNTIPQGTTASNRIGRQITTKSFHLRGWFETGAQASNDLFRMIIFLDQQCNGASIAIADLLSAGQDGTNYDIFSYLNLANSKRFKVLRDWTGHVNSGVWNVFGSNYGLQTVRFDENINIEVPIEFSSTTGNISEIKSNNIGIVFLSARGGDNVPKVGFVSRTRYTDA